MTHRVDGVAKMSFVSPKKKVLLLVFSLLTDAEAWAGSHGRPVHLPAACRPDSLPTKDSKTPGIRIVVTQFASEAKAMAKFLPMLSDKYAEAVRLTLKQSVLLRQDGGATKQQGWQVPAFVSLVPCSISSQEVASQLAKLWQVEAVLWGLVGVEESSSLHARQGLSSEVGGSSHTGTGDVSVSGTVITNGSSLACIGNNNDCRFYMFQAHGHPLQEPVIPILTMRQPAVSQEWDHDDTIKYVVSVAKSDTPSVLSRVQRAMLQVLAARLAMKHNRHDISYQFVENALKSLEQDERIPFGNEPIRLLAESALALDNETTESRALGALARCPEQDMPEQQCRSPILRALAKRAELQGKVGPARTWYETALEQWKLAHDMEGEISVHRRLAWLAIQSGQPERAEKHYREALSLLAGPPSKDGSSAVVRNDLGLLLAARGRADEAKTLFEQAIAMHVRRQDAAGEANARYNLGFLLRSRGQFDAAKREFLSASACYELVRPAALQQALESVVEAAYLSRRFGKESSDPTVEKKLVQLRSKLALNPESSK